MGKFDKLDEMQEQSSDLDKALNHSTPEAFTEWLIAAHGLNEESRQTVTHNLKGWARAERIKGSLVPLTDLDIEVSIFGLTTIRIRSRKHEDK